MSNELKKQLKVWSVAALVGAGLLGGASAVQAEGVGVEVGTDIVSKYIWRGQLLTDDPVLQPSVTLSYGNFAFNAWGSIDMTDINEDGTSTYNMQEVDYTLSYGFAPCEGVDMEVGVIIYDFPGTAFKTTEEVYASVSLSSLPLSPTLSVNYDYDEVDGYYANLSVGHSFELTEKLGLSLGAGLGWGNSGYNDAYFGVDSGQVNDLALSASLDYAVNDNFAISGYLGYSELVDSDIEGATDSSEIIGGVNFTFAF